MTEPKTSSQPDKSHPTSKNALKHGCYSKDIILPWEKAEDFDKLYQQYREDLNPQGVLEEGVVEQITQTMWLRMRLVRA